MCCLSVANVLLMCCYPLPGRAGLHSASVSSVYSEDIPGDPEWDGAGAVSKVSSEQRRAEMLRKKKRERFLRRMETDMSGGGSVSSQGAPRWVAAAVMLMCC